MTLHVHPIALGCMLVVAFGTLIYTYVTTRQQAQQNSYEQRSSYHDFDDWSTASISSRRSSVSEDNGQSSRKRKSPDHCSICLGVLKTSLKTLDCNHVFHAHCITTWLVGNNTCPICRSKAAI